MTETEATIVNYTCERFIIRSNPRLIIGNGHIALVEMRFDAKRRRLLYLFGQEKYHIIIAFHDEGQMNATSKGSPREDTDRLNHCQSSSINTD